MYPADSFLIHADLVTDMITESGQLSFLLYITYSFSVAIYLEKAGIVI